MKKSKLVIDYEFDFDVYGIISSSKGYKLAWEINNRLGTHLVKQTDLSVGWKNSRELSFAYYSFETAVNRLKLFRNKPNEMSGGKSRLVPEHPHFDYILLARLDEYSYPDPLPEILKLIPSVELVTQFVMEGLKSKSNFVF